jgi:hypothetical protein
LIRHNAVRDRLFLYLKKAGFPASREDRYLLAGVDGNGLKPADILVPAWWYNKDYCVDVSVVCPFTNIGSILPSDRSALLKSRKYLAKCNEAGLGFIPFIMESLGGFGLEAERMILRIAKATAHVDGLTVNQALRRMRTGLQFLAQRHLALGLLSRRVLSGGDA